MTTPDTGRRAPPGAPAPEPWTDVILHFIAAAVVVIVFLLILFGLTAVDVKGADDPAQPCASGPWDIGDQWGPGPDDVIGCTVESSGDPVPSFEPPGIDVPSRATSPSAPAPAPAVTTPPTDTLP